MTHPVSSRTGAATETAPSAPSSTFCAQPALGDPAQLVEQHARSVMVCGVRRAGLPVDQSGLAGSPPGGARAEPSRCWWRAPAAGARRGGRSARSAGPPAARRRPRRAGPAPPSARVSTVASRREASTGKRRLVQVEVREHRDAQLVHLQPEPVRAALTALEQSLVGEGDEQAVDGADPEPEPARQLGDAELPVGAGEGLQHPSGIADRRQPAGRIRRGHSSRLAAFPLYGMRALLPVRASPTVGRDRTSRRDPAQRAVPPLTPRCLPCSECPWQ